MGASYAGALASPAVQVPPHPLQPAMVWNPVSGWLDMRPTYEHTSSQCLLQIQQALLQSVQAAPGAVSSQLIRHPSPPQPGKTQQMTKKADPPKGGSASASSSTSAPPTKGGSIMRGRGRTPLTSQSDKAEPIASGADNQEWSQSQDHHRCPKPKSSTSGEAKAPSSWADDLRVEVQMAEGDQGGETHLISHMDTSEDPPSSEKPLEGPVDVEDSGPSLPKSEGWRVDFTTILKYFMKLHYPGITPMRMRQAIRIVLQWLDDRREYWQPVREGDPITFMKYLAQVVQEQTSLILPTLKWYTKWIKATSWHNAVVLRQEQLNLCPHLVRAELPKPNIRPPSEDTMLSHRTDYAATHKWVEEALVTLAKVQQNLHTSITICKGDHREIKPLELPVPIQAVPSTSGGGDTSRAPSTGLTGNKRHKKSTLGDPSCPGRSLNPFPLNPDDDERRAMVKILLDTTGSFGYATCEEVAESIHAQYPDLDMEACQMMANRILVTIAEYHLLCTIQDPIVVSLVVPREVLASLPPLERYYAVQLPPGISPNLRIIEEVCTLQFIIWLHKTDMCQQYGWEAAESIHLEDHTMGPLLSLFLCTGTGLMMAEAVFAHIVAENYDNLQECLKKTRVCLTEADAKFQHLVNQVKDLEEERAKMDKASSKKELHRKLKQELGQLRLDRDEARREFEQHRAMIAWCQANLDSDPYSVCHRLAHFKRGAQATEATCSKATGAQVTPAPTPAPEDRPVVPTPEQDTGLSKAAGGMAPLSEEPADQSQPDQQQMEVNAGNSPIRTEEEQLLLTGGQAEEDPSQSGRPLRAEVTPEAEAEAAREGSTGSETPSVGLASGLSHLTMTSP